MAFLLDYVVIHGCAPHGHSCVLLSQQWLKTSGERACFKKLHTPTAISAAHVSSVHHCCWTTLVCVSCLSLAAEVDVKSVDCNTLQVEYTVNPLPGEGNNEASLQTLVVKYRPILGAGSTGTRRVPLNGNPAEGVLCLSGLSPNTPYRVTYSVEVDTGASTGLPSDLSEPKELFTLRRCDQQNQCIETRTARKCNCIWSTACPQVYSGSTPCMCLFILC